MKQVMVVIAFVLFDISCDKDNPVKPVNHNPIILSLTVFPDVISLSDSAIVVVNAMDPDGDTLVYDWYSDGTLEFKGNPSWEIGVRPNTHENYQIVFPVQSPNFPPVDTVWVQVQARDGKGGGSVAQTVHFVVKQ